jgi:hypothetical protein
MSVVRDVDDAFGDPGGSVAGRALATLAHLLPYTLLAYLGLRAARWFSIIEPNIVISLIAGGVLVPVIGAGVFHTQLACLCLPCMQALPADAAVRVRRHLPLLWLVHQMKGRRLLFTVLGLFAAGTGMRILAGGAGDAGWWLDALAELTAMAVVWGNWVYHRYRPWCPHCRDSGGGGLR